MQQHTLYVKNPLVIIKMLLKLEFTVTIQVIIKFIDSFRHMPFSLSNLVDNLAELNKNLPADILVNRFNNTYKVSNNNISKFKLLLRKGIYPYEYMRSWKNFDEPVPLD